MKHYLERIAASWAYLGGAVLILIMLVTSINSLAFLLDRALSIFGINIHGLAGYEDFVRLAISCVALMFFPWCQYQRGHVFVDLFTNLMPQKTVKYLRYFWRLSIVVLAIFLAYWMFFGMLEIFEDNAKSPILGWPLWPFYGPGIASLILWALVALFQGYGSDITEENTHD